MGQHVHLLAHSLNFTAALPGPAHNWVTETRLRSPSWATGIQLEPSAATSHGACITRRLKSELQSRHSNKGCELPNLCTKCIHQTLSLMWNSSTQIGWMCVCVHKCLNIQLSTYKTEKSLLIFGGMLESHRYIPTCTTSSGKTEHSSGKWENYCTHVFTLAVKLSESSQTHTISDAFFPEFNV